MAKKTGRMPSLVGVKAHGPDAVAVAPSSTGRRGRMQLGNLPTAALLALLAETADYRRRVDAIGHNVAF